MCTYLHACECSKMIETIPPPRADPAKNKGEGGGGGRG